MWRQQGRHRTVLAATLWIQPMQQWMKPDDDDVISLYGLLRGMREETGHCARLQFVVSGG